MFDLRVLYAEDEEQIRNIFERILGKLTKEVYVATNGEEALGLYYEKNPDIIITDVKMPRMTGFEMAAEVRKKDKLIPIVAITAHNETEYFLEAIRLGVTNFLVKPIELEQLKEALVMVGEIVNLQRDNRQKTALLEQYKSAVDAANIVSKADKNGIITYVNELFCNVSGYSKDELIGKSHNIIRHADMPKETFADLWSTVKAKKIWRGIVKNLSKTNETYIVDTTVLPIVDENGEIEEYISIRTDVTALENALLRAKLAEKAKGDFLAAMSHEIRTPLNAILGFTSLLKETEMKSVRDEYISIIESSGKSLLAIINDILDYSKIESGSFEIEKAEFEPLEEFESAVELFAMKAYEKRIKLLTFIDPRLPKKIIGDPLRIKQIILNLLSNAIKFTPEEKHINVNVILSGIDDGCATILFEVIDEGIGISKDKSEKIFSPFSQADAGISRKYGGTGLGLSISSNLVSLMGGKLAVDSEEGSGSRFWFELKTDIADYAPSITAEGKYSTLIDGSIDKSAVLLLARYLESLNLTYTTGTVGCIQNADKTFVCESGIKYSDDPQKTIIISSSPFYGNDGMVGSAIVKYPINATKIVKALSKTDFQPIEKKVEDVKKHSQTVKVLVADDNTVNQKLVAAILSKHGYVSSVVGDGLQALDALEREKFDFVFLDINMPNLDGVETLVAIREKYKEKAPYIAALTANALTGDREKYIAIGFDGYLQKPLEERAILEILSERPDDIATKPERTTEDLLCILEEALGLDKESLMMLLEDFAVEAAEDLASLEDAFGRGDLKELGNYAHKIKGAAGNLRLDKLREISLVIEQKALSGVHDFDYGEAIHTLKHELAQINFKD